MSDERLPASIEAAAMLRRIQAQGDFATILKKGDPHRGTLLLLVTSRGRHAVCLERALDFSTGGYRWQAVGPTESASSEEMADFLQKRARFDADGWVIELDIADPERFIAETTSQG